MSIDRLRAHYGFTKMPFGKELAPQALYRSKGHAEAVARISWLISERGIGLVTGEVGAGKTVAARAATAGLDRSRYSVVYVGDPGLGVRGFYTEIVRTLGGDPKFLKANLIHQAQELLAAEDTERAKSVVIIADLCRHRDYADISRQACRNPLPGRAS